MRALLWLLLLAAPLAAAQAPSVAARTADGDAPRTAEGVAARNLILMIADGMGPASVTMARAVRPLALDSLLSGSVETSATDARVTDSAAGATAYACGIKTFNGAIGVDADRRPCRTLVEAARDAGMATGLVTTTRITHATPAAFAAHVPSRAEEGEIARQMAAAGVDLLLGGGARFFTPEVLGGSRTDADDLLEVARRAGVAVATSPDEWAQVAALPAWGLIAPDHLAYEIDRAETGEPSLAEMTRRALALLSAHGGERGFVVMIEGGRIDHAAHANDAPAHLRDLLAYDAAVAEALAFARADGRTLVVSTADHETGGLTLGARGVYAWDPAPLLAATMSAEHLARRTDDEPTAAAVAEALGDAAPDEAYAGCSPGPACAAAFVEATTRRAGLGWTTGGHTAVDVGLYAWGPGAGAFIRALPNDAVGRALFAALGLAP